MSQRKPRILVGIDWYLPGYRGGGPIRSVANLVAALGDEFDFSILTSDHDYGLSSPHEGITPDAWTPHAHGSRVWYCSRERGSYRHFRAILADADYDLLYLNSMFSLRYTIFLLWIARASHPDKPVVLAPRGMLHPGALSFKPLKKKLFLALLKWMGMHKQLRFHATDAKEVEHIRAIFGADAKVVEAPNLPQIQPPPFVAIDKQAGHLRLVFLSRISEKKGVHTLIEALQGQRARIELDIYGPDEEPGYWDRCQRLAASLPGHVQVRKHAPVPPADAAHVLQAAHAFAMPTLGENFGHAIFEALNAGRPVLISDQTPWRGLEAHRAGFDLSLAERGALAGAIARMAEMDGVEWLRWAEGARGLAQAYVRDSDALARARGVFAI